jgi:CDP-glucose 4,6-dehydratase
MNPAFWKGRRVFLTGQTGFKGSWLALWLQELGAEITGYALPPPTIPSLFEKALVAKGMNSIEGDVRDLAKLTRALREARPEIVIHMAAQPLVRKSYQDPVETYSTNVMGTVNLLEAVRSTDCVRAVVNVTTDKCYENREWIWPYRESEPMGGYDPYSSSKGCAELVTTAYRNSFFPAEKFTDHGVALASARAGNVIGGGDWASDRLIPDMVSAFSEGRSVAIRNPHAIRPWQHVLEPLRGYLTLAHRLHDGGSEFAEAFNFGPAQEDAQPVQWIVEHMKQLWGPGANWHLDGQEHPHEASYLKLDISKAAHRLGWKPVLQLPQALKMTAEWYQPQSEGETARQLTVSQIASYMKICPSTL